jgi:hypothetical protein
MVKLTTNKHAQTKQKMPEIEIFMKSRKTFDKSSNKGKQHTYSYGHHCEYDPSV